MDLFNRVGEELSNMGSEFVRLTKDASETARQHAAIVSEKGRINEQFRLLGELLYEYYKEDAEMLEILPEEFKEAFLKVAESKQKIADAKDNIAQSKGGVICPECGSCVPKGSAYCNKCGRMM